MTRLMKIVALLIVVLMITSCQGGDKKKAREFAVEFEAIQQKYKDKLKTAGREQYMTIMNDRVNDFNALLEKYKDSPVTDEIEIIKSKILLNISMVEEAEQKIDKILAKESNFKDDAKLVKVQAMFLKNKTDEGYKIFKEIEPRVSRGEELFNAYLYLALFASDNNVSEDYAQKFIAAEDIPEDMVAYKPRVYSALASVAKARMKLDEAQQYLQKALELEKNPQFKRTIEAEIAQLGFIGKPALDIAAETWFNTSPLTLTGLKGKVVVIDFWATWCNPCRLVMPGLIAAYDKYKEQGLVVIGFTKLYGDYTDDLGKKGTVNAKEEIALVKEFVKRHRITYPIAVSNEGKEFENYRISGIPTMIFINKAGNISEIEIGVTSPLDLENKIKKLLEEI